MTDVFEHNLGDHEDPVAGPTWLIGFIGVVLLVVVVLGVTSVYFQAEEREEREVVLAVEPLDLEETNRRQLAQLEGPRRWIVSERDGQKIDEQLVIPIEEAMRLVVQEMGEAPGE